MKKTFVFVYGTLMRGEANHRLLVDAERVGAAVTMGQLFDLGSFPALVLTGTDDLVDGELYRVTDAELAALDRLEGVKFGLYTRVKVAVLCGERKLRAQTYTQSRAEQRGRPRIESGSWREHKGRRFAS